LFIATLAAAQSHEVGFTLGRLAAQSRTGLTLNSGTALQANYAYRLKETGRVALLPEVHLLASPQRQVSATAAAATRDVASLYVTPGLRVKFFPGAKVQPYGVAGGGYALYEHSRLNMGGAPNAAPRTASTGTWMYGAGVDVPVAGWLALRGEVRDFYSGNARYNVPQASARQHNVVVGGGFVLRLGGR